MPLLSGKVYLRRFAITDPFYHICLEPKITYVFNGLDMDLLFLITKF